MGEMTTNKLVGIAIISVVILLAIWKIPVMGDFEWGIGQKIFLSFASVGIISFLVWLRD